MKKILLSVAILAIAGAVVVGGTTAIFTDEEVSSGNTFTAGAIDLTVDNESYYNGELNDGTSWLQKDLEDGDWFFDFRDLKPGDWGEDTISLHVKNNDSYLCADVTLTSNQDNGSNEPELKDEGDDYDAGRGELGDRVTFIAWADDGDNVPEVGEQVYNLGPIGNLRLGETETAALADSKTNVWNENNEGGPLPGDSVRYIGKAWCFGEMNVAPLEQDGLGKYRTDENPDTPNGPLIRGKGFTCDGSGEDNSTQTDSLTADISFRAVQSRHNDNYVCEPENVPTTATLTIDKVITFSNPDLDPVEISDFTFLLNGEDVVNMEVFDEVPVPGLAPGTYTVSETGPSGFVASYGLDCDANGQITLVAGDNSTCRLINVDER